MNYKLPGDYLVATYPNRGITFMNGEGVYLIDQNGEKYLDFGSNYGINIFGYKHPRISKALKEQLQILINLHGSFNSDVRNLAAKKLIERCNHNLSRVFFSNSGAESIETALKFARLATGKSHFIAMENAYHGKTLGALSATGGDKYRNSFLPLIWNFSHIVYGDINAIRANITKDTAAIIIEPVQGEGGIRLASCGYFKLLQLLCNQHNILLIVDEIQTGLGRTGTFLASEQCGLTPDILCLGKGLAGGIPIGVTLVTEPIAQKIPLHVHTSTFGGNPLACAGIIAVLKELEDSKIFAHIKDMGKYFLTQLQKIRHAKIIEARGMGLMLGLELKENATSILKTLQKERIIAIPAGQNIIRFLPPYIITRKEIDKVIAILNNIF